MADEETPKPTPRDSELERETTRRVEESANNPEATGQEYEETKQAAPNKTGDVRPNR